MKHRMAANNLRDDNLKMRTRLQMAENELARKDKMIDELLLAQQDNSKNGGKIKIKIDSLNLMRNLRRKVREQQVELQERRDQVDLLKRNIKNTRTNETEVEIKLYQDECLRLRASLEEVIKSKDTFADPQELQIIEQKF